MNREGAYFERGFQKKLFLFALAFAVFAAAVIDVMLPLLLTDIAKTFSVPVGTAATIASISSLVGVGVGLLMAILTVRFNHKPLLLVGVLCISLAALGSYLAPSLLLMQTLYSLNGVGSVMVGAMAFTLIGEVYPLEKRGKAVGWIVAAGFLAFTVGAPMTGILASIGNWRSIMLWFNLPVSIASLIFAFVVIPSTIGEKQRIHITSVFAGYGDVLKNRSALACLIGSMFAFSTTAITTYVISFWRNQFALTASLGSIITMINATSAAAGGLVAGRILNRTGRKLLGVSAGLVESVLIILTVFMPSLILSEIVSLMRVWCYGMMAASFASLTLEQVPKFRGTMMSLRGTFGGIGAFLGIQLGAIALNSFNYQMVGILLGSLGFAAIATFLFLTKDTNRISLVTE